MYKVYLHSHFNPFSTCKDMARTGIRYIK